MMKFAAAVLATAVVASPALAGPRVEVHAGWDHAGAFGEHDSDVTYGVGVGYDLPVGERLFAGIEANLDGSSVRDCDRTATDSFCTKAGRDLSVGGRFGTMVGPQSKLYVLAGYTNAKVRATYSTVADGVVFRDSVKLDGFRLGAGYQFTSQIGPYFKVEYRYSNYEQNFSRHQVLGGVGVEF